MGSRGRDGFGELGLHGCCQLPRAALITLRGAAGSLVPGWGGGTAPLGPKAPQGMICIRAGPPGSCSPAACAGDPVTSTT